MIMVLLQLDVLPQSSTAVQVLVTLYSCGQAPGTVASEKVMFTNASHASIDVGVPNDGVDQHSIGLTTTGHVITGGVLSWMLIVALQLEELPQSSVAIQVLVTLYS